MLKFLKRYNDRFVSKWLILGMDVFVVALSFLISTAFKFNLQLTYVDPSLFKYHLLWVILIRVGTFIFFKTYEGIIRHSGVEDSKLLIKATFFSSLEILLFNQIGNTGFLRLVHIPNTIVLIDFFILSFGLIASRLFIKTIYESLTVSFKSNKKVMIYGSGRLGMVTKNTLQGDQKNNFKILCFIEDNPQKIGKSLEGIKILSKADALKMVDDRVNVEIEIIVAIQSISTVRKNDLVDEFLEKGLKVRIVPPVKQWINGHLSVNQIQEVRIEDLLERPAIEINNRFVKSFIFGKRIMITGAAGSIGSEIVRQILHFEPSELLLIDQAESPLYDLETELSRVTSKVKFKTKIIIEIKNISNEIQTENVFINYRPQVVFHAAAYKHVPLMESNPFKALEVNTFGTKLLADLASKYNVEKFVFISTDKAVNPTNVMGASKRLAEMYVQSLNTSHKNDTRFIVTRFGNVLGSNGSVIPLFKKQIEKGGPVTVTHPDIIRYFMTIPEACQLVLEAGTMGKGGEIYVFDMGVPVKILDLAIKMIKLSGFEPYKQIDIEFSGLRAGEKLFEELLGDEEKTIATHHSKIMVAKVKAGNHEELNESLSTVKFKLNQMSGDEIVAFLKLMVPDYISKNSPFEELDKVNQ